MRSFLIHKNQSLYRWIRRRTGRRRALRVANTVEKIILNIDTFFLIGFLTFAAGVLVWIFLVFLNVTSF